MNKKDCAAVYCVTLIGNEVLTGPRDITYPSLHLMLQGRIDSAQYKNYKIPNISKVEVSWSDAISEMPSSSVSKTQ